MLIVLWSIGSVLLLFLVYMAICSMRGWKTAKQLHCFISTYQSEVKNGIPKDRALRGTLHQLRQAPRFDALTAEDIDMIVRVISVLNRPELLIERLVMMPDTRKTVLIMKDEETVKKMRDIVLRQEAV